MRAYLFTEGAIAADEDDASEEAGEATAAPARIGSTSVIGPGQSRPARSRATPERSTSRSAIAMSATCAISGLKLGRPFAA